MATNTTIEWTEATWNPVRGCSRVSEGCRFCYAERMAARFSGTGMAFHGLAKMTKAGPRWTGKVLVVEDAVELPLRWRRPRRVFVNSMSDLFHVTLPDADVCRVFDVMNRADWHQYQVLTKRSERLAEIGPSLPWAPHIWMGVSVESDAVRHRVDDLRCSGAAVKFLSLEPLIGPLENLDLSGIDWVIVGGESGPGARALDTAWVENLLGQCRAAGVACFVKQFGAVWAKRNRSTSAKGGNWTEWPEALRVREFPAKRA